MLDWRLHAKATTEELEAFNVIAWSRGLGASDLLRQLVLQELDGFVSAEGKTSRPFVPADQRKLEKLAMSRGMTMAGWIRDQIRRAELPVMFPPVQTMMPGLPEESSDMKFIYLESPLIRMNLRSLWPAWLEDAANGRPVYTSGHIG